MIFKHKFFFIGILFIIFCFSSCITNSLNSPQQENNQKPEGTALYFYKTRFANLIDTAQFIYKRVPLEATEEIKLFYQRRLFKPAWTKEYAPTKSADSLISLLKNAEKFALRPKFYHVKLIEKLRSQFSDTSDLYDQLENTCNLELLLSNAAFLFTKHLNRGILDIDTLSYPIQARLKKIDLTGLINNCVKNENISSILSVQPQNYRYKNLLSAYNWFITHSSTDNIKISIPDTKKDSLKAYSRAKQVLVKNGFLIANKNFSFNPEDENQPKQNSFHNSPINEIQDTLFINALKIFQKFNGLNQDGKIGKYTRIALERTNKEKYESLLLTIEKLRWENQMPQKYIFVNIPSFKLRYIRNDSIVSIHKIVVGLPRKQTPLLSDTMEYFITFPEWNVPLSITSHEILPKLQTDSSYISRNNFIIYDKNLNAINVHDVDWNQVTSGSMRKYYIKQSGGNSNALGTIKFIFPNSYYVYIHDTPSKRYFNKDIRAFSHGCVRLQNPWQFAQFLLKNDNRSNFIDTLMHFKEKKWQRYVNLKQKLPVFFRYQTVEADEKNNLYFYMDIYKRDKQLLPSFKEKFFAKKEIPIN